MLGVWLEGLKRIQVLMRNAFLHVAEREPATGEVRPGVALELEHDRFGAPPRAISCHASLIHAACDPLQKGLLSDLPHLHKVTRFLIS
jgi:hypothetical protein